jgi:SAM-dependent methyltransferase
VKSELAYNQKAIAETNVGTKTIYSFDLGDDNIDHVTVESFGEEWNKFSEFNSDEIESIGDEYFDVVPEGLFKKESTTVIDLGCGTGRWSVYMSDKVKEIHALDPSKAVFSAAQLTQNIENIHLTQASVDNIPFEDETFDFGISLGVLHHIPDTEAALKSLSQKIKSGGHLLIYLYYALDNRSAAYRALFNMSTFFRRGISKMPAGLKKFTCDLIAFLVYLPFVGLASFVKLITKGDTYKKMPLSYYVGKSLNVIRNDSLDRFGTPLEQRFTKAQITEMMTNCGFEDLVFSEKMPCWHVIGKKK